jgi:hypothetical protein
MEPMRSLSPEFIARHYSNGPSKVRARFEVYGLERPFFDIEGHSLDTLHQMGRLAGEETVADIGTADAQLPERMVMEYGHRGEVHAVEPQREQHPDFSNLSFSLQDWQQMKTLAEENNMDFAAIKRAYAEHKIPNLRLFDSIQIHQGAAQDLGMLADGSIDLMFYMFMLYHIDPSERQKVYEEMRRISNAQTIGIIATSGAGNKSNHRTQEERVASYTGTLPPPHMNSGFTSEIARTELAEEFNYVYEHHHTGSAAVQTLRDLKVYINSIRSLHDLFTPVPDIDLFEQGLVEVERDIIGAWLLRGGYYDVIERSVFFVSKKPLIIPRGSGFAPIIPSR